MFKLVLNALVQTTIALFKLVLNALVQTTIAMFKLQSLNTKEIYY